MKGTFNSEDQQTHSLFDTHRNILLKMNVIGDSVEFREAMDKALKISQCDAPVMIEGETGTGKEIVARIIHYTGSRMSYPFLAINCGALPDNLIENELFGHDVGAYTDAKRKQEGLVAQAEGGTLFLDEIEALTLKAQVTLLRFLQDYEYRPLGSNKKYFSNIRIITASNVSLKKLVDNGVFRQDLYYRINIMNITLPSLRDRGSDVCLLADHFIEKFRQQYNEKAKYISAESKNLLKRNQWPGNVRELENYLHREFLFSDGDCIVCFPPNYSSIERRNKKIDRRQAILYEDKMSDAKNKLIEEFERNYISAMLTETKGNISAAAKKSGKERRTFTKLIEKHCINVSSYRI